MASKQAVAWVVYNIQNTNELWFVQSNALMEIERTEALVGIKGAVERFPPLEDEHRRWNSLSDALCWAQDCNKEVAKAAKFINKLIRTSPFEEVRLLPSLDDKGKFSYSRKPEDLDAKRVKTSFGRIIRRKFELGTEYINDAILTKLSEILTKQIWPDLEEVVELKGSAIVQAYGVYTGTSCMSGSDQSKYVKLYANNHDKVSLLAVFEGEWCKAKALIWNCDDGTKMLDRVYTDCGCSRYRLSIEAKAQSMGALVGPNMESGQQPAAPKSVILDIAGLNCAPYFDSFSTAEYINGCDMGEKIRVFTHGYNSQYDSFDLKYTEGFGISMCCGISFLSENDGKCPKCGRQTNLNCASCGDAITDGEEINGEHYCGYCVQRSFTRCEECYEFVINNGVLLVGNDTICRSCVESMSIQNCSSCGELFHEEDGEHTEEGFFCNYCFNEKFSHCSECGEIVENRNLFDDLCEDCHNNKEEEKEVA